MRVILHTYAKGLSLVLATILSGCSLPSKRSATPAVEVENRQVVAASFPIDDHDLQSAPATKLPATACQSVSCVLDSDTNDRDMIERVVQGDPVTVDTLKKVLSDRTQQLKWRRAVDLLGFTADSRAYPVLTEFLLRDDSELPMNLVSGTVYQAKTQVPSALGELLRGLNTSLNQKRETQEGKREIREFIKGHLRPSPDTWRDLTWTAVDFAGDERPRMLNDLSLGFIHAIAVSNDPVARGYLDWLAKHLHEQRTRTKNGADRVAVAKVGYPPGVVSPAFFDMFDNAIKAASLAGKKP